MMIESPTVPRKVDRLSAFFDAFDLSASLETVPTADGHIKLHAIGPTGGPAERVILYLRGEPRPDPSILVSATIDFGGAQNPLMNALPNQVSVETNDVPALRDTTAAFVTEALEFRCGRNAALDRLCEVIVLLVLRSAIDRGAAQPGLLAGLSHPALHRVLVAMHEGPGRVWNTDDLASVAGMSRSHFMALFRQVVGVTPQAYLTRWRLTIARRMLSKGARVKAVARQVGFGSAAAFSRAYVRQFAEWPSHQTPST
jgi:AraC-like DNA-binding protein